MTYAEVLQQSGYVGGNGVAILCKRNGNVRRQEAMDMAAGATVFMSQTPGNEDSIIDGRGGNSKTGPSVPSTEHKGTSGRRAMTADERTAK